MKWLLGPFCHSFKPWVFAWDFWPMTMTGIVALWYLARICNTASKNSQMSFFSTHFGFAAPAPGVLPLVTQCTVAWFSLQAASKVGSAQQDGMETDGCISSETLCCPSHVRSTGPSPWPVFTAPWYSAIASSWSGSSLTDIACTVFLDIPWKQIKLKQCRKKKRRLIRAEPSLLLLHTSLY